MISDDEVDDDDGVFLCFRFVSEFTDLHKFSVLSLAARVLKIIPVIPGQSMFVCVSVCVCAHFLCVRQSPCQSVFVFSVGEFIWNPSSRQSECPFGVCFQTLSFVHVRKGSLTHDSSISYVLWCGSEALLLSFIIARYYWALIKSCLVLKVRNVVSGRTSLTERERSSLTDLKTKQTK